MTFSIVAWDPEPRVPEWGVAVASKFLSVGAVVPWARAGVGAIATQALANISYGPDGLALLGESKEARDVVEELTSADDGRDERQLGAVDGEGNAATYTGENCLYWAGGRTGGGYACQGNILTGPDVVDALAETFESASGSLTQRLLEALLAGDRAGGDSRGRQSAAVKVVREGGGYGGGSDLAVDLRVDDHADPVVELQRLFELHTLYFPNNDDLEYFEIDDELAQELRDRLTEAGIEVPPSGGFDDRLASALTTWAGVENLEERIKEGPMIERRVLEHLRHPSTS